ncbi:MAG: Lrp/AsnC family transcriptional regulator [Hyphomonas sp.]|uniref:Lrp/AsnC family transcriptional regulator n=1 Tax=Hyphomonas sp. TaxID=87 RepID=UPI0034A097F9
MTADKRKQLPVQQVPALYAPSGARLDATDLKILRLLQTGARESIQAIAERIQLSHSGTLHRLRRLEESGAVLRYMAELDESIFEAWPIFWIDIAFTRHRADERGRFDKAVADAPEVMEAIEFIGEFDLILKAALRNAAHWPALKASIDPGAEFIDRAQLRPVARIVKRAVPHPQLETGQA